MVMTPLQTILIIVLICVVVIVGFEALDRLL